MYDGVKKLARLIKLAGRDVSKESSWWKVEKIGPALGLMETDAFPHEISVTDDSGYRSITIGDTRGNVSRVSGRRITKKERKGYMLLYCENASYKGNERVWKNRCFPSQKEIEERLQKVIDKVPLDKNNCDSDEFWYEERDDAALTYYSEVVKRYADAIAKDKRTAEEIFADCW